MRRCQVVTPYEGIKPYIFASYCHRDSEKVFPIIERLARDGYRVWYDEGIEPGEEWPESIATHLNNCHICIAFISPRYMASHNCWRELNYALQQKKQFLIVFIEETEMSAGMQMQLSATQSIFKYLLPSDEEFFRKLYSTKALSECRGESVVIDSMDGSETIRSGWVGTAEEPQWQAKKNKRRGLIIALCAVIAVAFVICAAIFVLPHGGSDNDEQTKAAGTETGADSDETSEETTETTNKEVEYVNLSGDISSDLLSQMKSKAEDVFAATTVLDMDLSENLDSFLYQEMYFLNLKENASGDANRVYLVYKVTVTNYIAEDGMTYYWYCCFRDIYYTEDNEVTVDFSDYIIPDDVYVVTETMMGNEDIRERLGLGDYYYNYNGYETMDALYTDLIAPLLASYDLA